MARPRPRRIARMVLSAALIGQLPGLTMLARLVGWLPSLALAACLSAPLLLRTTRGFISDSLEKGPLALGLMVFYWWWGGSLLAGFAYLPALAASLLAGAQDPARVAAAAALAAGSLGGLLGITWNRLRPRLVRVEISVAGLQPELDGYRIAQISDLHLGGHTPPSRLRSWVDRVNALEADLVAVTGDLITHGNELVDSLAAELGRLRARDTVAVCLGNHDYFADVERLVAALEGSGLEVLRNRGRVVESARGRYFLAGVDDTWTGRADVAASLADRPAGLSSVVLAHDPNLFPECAELGAGVVLSGHTHGGQLALPVFPRFVNIARIAYRHTAGLYRSGASWLYVNRGAGTTGPPLRIGSPSEIALITLRAAAAEPTS